MVVAVFAKNANGLPCVNSDEILRYYDERKYILRELSVEDQLWKDDHVGQFEEIVCRCESVHNGKKKNGGEQQRICLQRLSLSNNGLTALCGDKLARILEVVGSLQELDLSENNVQSVGLEKLARALTADHCALRSLNLFNNHLGSACAKSIARILRKNRSIVSLNLGKNRLQSRGCFDKLAQAIASNEYLQRLGLSNNRFGDARVGQLALILDPEESRCPLRELDLSNNSLTEIGVGEIFGACLEGNNTMLEILNLSNNNLGNGGIKFCAIFLQRSHTIQELMLASCGVGDKEVNLLCEGLSCSVYCASSLKRLDLGWNSIHNSGAMRLATVLESDTIMEVLNLESNGIGSAGAQALCVSLRSNLTLRELDVSGNQIRDFGAFRMAEFVCQDDYSLTALKWDNKRMTENGRARLEAAFRFRQAKKGWLGEKLKQISKKRGKWMNSMLLKVGDEEMICICNQLHADKPILPKVIFTGLDGSGAVTSRAVEHLAGTVVSHNSIHLESLSLQNTRMGDLGAAAIAQSLIFNNRLTSLSLTSCGITNQGAIFISNMLRRNRILRRLDLKKNRIGDRGAQELFGAICEPTHPTMYSINLSENLLTDHCFGAIASFEPLKQVVLGDNLITDRGALDLAKVFMDSPNLELFHVPGNYLTDRGKQVLRCFKPDGVTIFECERQHKHSQLQQTKQVRLESAL